jgi:HK97 family phage prohead protease
MERKSISFELKDLDKTKRTAIIAHAAYDNIDFTKDISRKGMFTKSWQESKNDISFYLNHNDEQAPGKVVDVYEDDKFAYTKAWLGTHTLGNDVLTMMDEGVIKKASFGYITDKSSPITIKGQKIRELKEVKHLETSVLTKMPANMKAGIVSVTKAFNDMPEIKALSLQEQNVLKNINSNDQSTLEKLIAISASLEPNSDLYMWVTYNISRRADIMGEVRSQLRYNSAEISGMKSHIKTLENFCRNTKASDDCIKTILEDIEETKQFIQEYNTAFTLNEPGASVWNGWFNN